MSFPDFDRAQYVEPPTPAGYTGDFQPGAHSAAFPKALLYGLGAAIVGAAGYALTGFPAGWCRSLSSASRG